MIFRLRTCVKNFAKIEPSGWLLITFTHGNIGHAHYSCTLESYFGFFVINSINKYSNKYCKNISEVVVGGKYTYRQSFHATPSSPSFCLFIIGKTQFKSTQSIGKYRLRYSRFKQYCPLASFMVIAIIQVVEETGYWYTQVSKYKLDPS